MPQSKHKRKNRRKKANAGPTPAVPDATKRSIALEYLHQWGVDKEVWSFKKKPQYWLLEHMYNKKQVRKSDFKLLVKYLEGLKGYQRTKLLEKAQDIVEHYSEGSNDSNRLQYKRAKKILCELKD